MNEISENVVENNVVDDESDIQAQAYDYYDSYYTSVLNNLNQIKTNENTIIKNQETVIACCQQYNSQLTLISFLIAIILCYNFIKSILKV